jgi:hypothetical protein
MYLRHADGDAADHSKIDRPNAGNGGVFRRASPLR